MLRGELRPTLTPAEMRVMRLRAQGYTMGETADELGIRYNTVRQHVHHALERLGVSEERRQTANSAPLIEAFRTLGWLQVPE